MYGSSMCSAVSVTSIRLSVAVTPRAALECKVLLPLELRGTPQACAARHVLTRCVFPEYKDTHILPRASSVLARRVPPSRAGKGNAAQYVADLGVTGGGKGEERFNGPNASGVAAPTAGPSGSGSRPPQAARGVGMMTRRFDGKSDERPVSHDAQ